MTLVAIPSPCTGVCKIGPTGFCIGCARTADEIAVWRQRSDEWQAEIWKAIQPRFEALGVVMRRIPWNAPTITDFVATRLASGQATCVLGVVGAIGEFMPASGERVAIDVQGDVVTAVTPGARLRLRLGTDVRLVAYEAADPPSERAVVIGVLRERGRPALADGIQDLGPDLAAIDPDDREMRLYDLGLGRKAARFSVRVATGETQRALDAHIGVPFPESLLRIGEQLRAASPTRVVETALGRLEVSTPIPPASGRSPDGPYTHLLPTLLSTARDLPVGYDLPKAYLPGAMLHLNQGSVD